ncbi:kinase-like domain-containing protein [Mycena sanguinolenta]|nr:kinase-like domain-containing protein [Mycena sanguinolenta]
MRNARFSSSKALVPRLSWMRRRLRVPYRRNPYLRSSKLQVLDRGSLPSAEDASRARRLIIRLSEVRDQLPASLFIPSVTDHDMDPTFCGGFGDIYRASYNGTKVALKRIRGFQASADSLRSRLQFCREALVWQTLRHKYVLPFIGIDRETFSSFCLVSPWMQHGTVLRYLREHGREDVDKMLLQIAEGLAYLHSMKIVHGDLRGNNILVSDDWNACLADFGLASAIEDTASTTGGALTSNHAGSPRWFAPELIIPTQFGCHRFVRTTASDVYAFACVCIELHTGSPPFFEVKPDFAAMMKVVAGERPSRPASMSDHLWDLVTVAWAQDFRERPIMEKMVASMRAPTEGLAADPGVDLVNAFLHSQKQRSALLAQGLSDSYLRDALSFCEHRIGTSLQAVLGSRDAKCAVFDLEGTRAQAFLDAAQAVLDRGSLPSADDRSRARRLIIRLSEARDQLPASLFISGVTDLDEHPTFGGSSGDIYRASYNGSRVALKRIKFLLTSTSAASARLQFCREALVWQTLRHKYVLPFIGIDRETFSSFCLVSPWMQHGTVLRYLRGHGREDVDKMLLQIAEGLAYLHSMNIVHGDLRGNNILVSDDWSACLADFGLEDAIEGTGSTAGGALTSTTRRAGNVQWFSPELIAPTDFGCHRFVRTTASDVYAFACVCLELHTGRPPFGEYAPIVAMLQILKGERPSRPASMSVHLWDLVTTAWAQDFHDRPSMERIVESMRTLQKD